MEKNVSDEIDLYDLLVKTVRIFKKNSWLFGILILLGVGTSFMYYSRKPSIIVTRMIVYSDVITAPYCNVITETLDLLIRARSFDSLASRLNVSLKEASQIESIRSDVDKKNDSIFIVAVNLHDKKTIPKIQDGILHYLQNWEFMKVRIRQRKELDRIMIDQIEKGIKSMDSLQTRLSQGRPAGSTVSSILTDPGIVYSRIIKLREEQIKYKNALALAEGIQLVALLPPF
jgi:hypothetical protein